MRCPDTEMADQVRFSFTCCSEGCEFDVSCGLREVTLGVTAVAGHVKAAGHALCDFSAIYFLHAYKRYLI